MTNKIYDAETIEAAAKAIYAVGASHDEEWAKAHSRTKMTYRSMAEAALSALPTRNDAGLVEAVVKKFEIACNAAAVPPSEIWARRNDLEKELIALSHTNSKDG